MTANTFHVVAVYTIYAATVHVICVVPSTKNKKIEKNNNGWEKILKIIPRDY